MKELLLSENFLIAAGAVLAALLAPSPAGRIIKRLAEAYLNRVKYDPDCGKEIKKRARKPKPKEK